MTTDGQTNTGSIAGDIITPAPATNTATAPGNAGSVAKTFTQDEIDTLMAERASRAKKAAVKEFLEELGFEKPDDLKALVTAAKERDASQKTDAEKAQAALVDAQEKLAKAEHKRIDALITHEVIYHASQLGFINPKEALKLIDISKITVGDDDSVIGAEDAVKVLADGSKHLLKQADNKKPALPATNPAGAGMPSSIKEMMDARMGRSFNAATDIFTGPGGGVVGSSED